MADLSLSSAVAEIKANPGKFYVYVLSRPDGTPFYVGVGGVRQRGKQRIEIHEAEAAKPGARHNKHKLSTILQILAGGLAVRYEIDSWHLSSPEAMDREIGLIASIGRADQGCGPLTNWTGGGEGLNAPTSEVRQKLSHRMRLLHDDPAFTKKRDATIAKVNACPDLREKSNAAARAANDLPKNKQRILAQLDLLNSPDRIVESTRRIRALNNDPEFVAKSIQRSRAVMLRNQANPEFWKRHAEGNAKRRGDPEFKETCRERWRKLCADPVKREGRKDRASKSMLTRWNDPDYRDRVMKARAGKHQTPEYRAKRSAIIKAKWRDPEYREKIMASRRAAIERKKSQLVNK